MLYNPSHEHTKERIAALASPLIKRHSYEYMYSKEYIEKEENLFEIYRSPSGWKVILVEFMPIMVRKPEIEMAVFYLNTMGISPLLAHIERYGMPERFWAELKNKYSVFYQASVRTLAKSFLDIRKNQVMKMLDQGIIDNMSTDIHKTEHLHAVEKGLDFFMMKYGPLRERLFSLSFEP